MSERYPTDVALLALTEDAATGVEYIATGRSPYVIEFRRLVQRLALAAQRANDLRVYADGDLSVGVRGGRCVMADQSIVFAGAEAVAVDADAVTYVWLDAAGQVQTSTEALPTDRTTFVPLAVVAAGPGAISDITDLRGEAMLHVPSLPALAVTATADQINAALAGIDASVTAAALNVLTGGQLSTADGHHRHVQFTQDVDGEAYLRLHNDSSDAAANIGISLNMDNRALPAAFMQQDLAHGFVTQRVDGQTYQLVGIVHAQHTHAGALDATVSDALVGVVPLDGEVVDVVLSVAGNIESDESTDGISAAAKVNGQTLTTAHPQLTDAAGGGFRCTAQGDGTAAVVKSDGTQQVTRGDVLTVDLVRSVTGTVSREATDVVMLNSIRAAKPG